MTDRRQMARTPWRTLTSRPVYQNRWIRVREDQVALPDGEIALDTSTLTPQAAVDRILTHLETKGFLHRSPTRL